MSTNGVIINAQSATIKDISRLTKKFTRNSQGCWIWSGAKYENGYGEFSFHGKPRRAHRFIYELLKGKIHQGLVIDHLCREVSCINPKHLEAVTQKVNIYRSNLTNKSDTHCSKGHILQDNNVSIYRNKKRCRTCFRAYRNKYNAKRGA